VNESWKNKRMLLVLAAVILLVLLWQGSACASAVLSNVGMTKLNRVMGSSGQVASLESLTEAEYWFKQSLAWNASNPAAHRGLGWIWEARGDLTRAAREWEHGGFSAREFYLCAQMAASAGQEDFRRLWLRRALAMQP
jgi:hypothetical protein